jgi:hypothetical protein
MPVIPSITTTSAIIEGVAEHPQVRLSGDITGTYVVVETRPDGRLVLAPDVSASDLREEIGARSLTQDEWQDFLAQHGPEMLPPDQEG